MALEWLPAWPLPGESTVQCRLSPATDSPVVATRPELAPRQSAAAGAPDYGNGFVLELRAQQFDRVER
jgi:hypothetical protein